MSSRKTTATKPVRRPKAAPRTAAKSKPSAARVVSARAKTTAKAPAKTVAPSALAIAAKQLAADLKRSLAAGQFDALPPETVQALLTVACRLYSAQSEAGEQYLPVGEVNSTDIMVTASGLLKAGNLAVFELGMWQSWTGR
jgi:hypothetical protein